MSSEIMRMVVEGKIVWPKMFMIMATMMSTVLETTTTMMMIVMMLKVVIAIIMVVMTMIEADHDHELDSDSIC